MSSWESSEEEEEEDSEDENSTEYSDIVNEGIANRGVRKVTRRTSFSSGDEEFWKQKALQSSDADESWEAQSDEIRDVMDESVASGWSRADQSSELGQDGSSDRGKSRQKRKPIQKHAVEPARRYLTTDLTTHKVPLPLPFTFKTHDPAAAWRDPTVIPPIIETSNFKKIKSGQRIAFVNGRSVGCVGQIEDAVKNIDSEVEIGVVGEDEEDSAEEEEEEEEEEQEEEEESVVVVKEKFVMKPAAKKGGGWKAGEKVQKERIVRADQLARDTTDSLAEIIERMKKAEDVRAEQREALKRKRRAEAFATIERQTKDTHTMTFYLEPLVRHEVDYTANHSEGVTESGQLATQAWNYHDPITHLGFSGPLGFKVIRQSTAHASHFLLNPGCPTPNPPPPSVPSETAAELEADNVPVEEWRELVTRFAIAGVPHVAGVVCGTGKGRRKRKK